MTSRAGFTGATMHTLPPTRPPTTAVEVRDLSKSFRIPLQRVDTLKERIANPFSRRGYRELRALDEVSFDIQRGSFYGIVGRNGSGKSTLLKVLASIYRADAGRIRVAGTLVPFIELGVGFNVELTARENVVLNGVMMGLTPREARARFDEVVDFAELQDFADLKLKNYSSGMLVRLGFALMLQVDAGILLIDEVLAVGDASFQQKCFDAFARLHEQNRTIVLVTHDMSAIEAHCDQALLLDGGHIVEQGDSADVGRSYLRLNFSEVADAEPEDLVAVDSVERVRFTEARVVDESGAERDSVGTGDPLLIEAEVEILRDIQDPLFGFQIYNSDGLFVYAPEPITLSGASTKLGAGDRVSLRVTVTNELAADHYFVHLAVGRSLHSPELIGFRKNATDFVVYGNQIWAGVVRLDSRAEVVRLPRERP